MGNGFWLFPTFKVGFIIKVSEKYIKYEIPLRIIVLYWYYIKI